MPVILEIRSGPLAGKNARVTVGQALRIGRASPSNLVFSDDVHMSGVHFLVEYDGIACRLADLNSRNGTAVNGQKVTTAILANGDTVVAGETMLRVRFEGEGAATAGAEPGSVVASSGPSPHDQLIAFLRRDAQPLFAILDAARDIKILNLLLKHQPPCQSLYEGAQGAKLAQVAPYLVKLPNDSQFLEVLVREGWGNSWGVYLTCDQDFSEVRRHLRHFLQVQLPEGKHVYFRFYDPRVLRVYLPTGTPDEARAFFGPIRNYFIEGDEPEQLLQFSVTDRGLKKKVIPVSSFKHEAPALNVSQPAAVSA